VRDRGDGHGLGIIINLVHHAMIADAIAENPRERAAERCSVVSTARIGLKDGEALGQ